MKQNGANYENVVFEYNFVEIMSYDASFIWSSKVKDVARVVEATDLDF